MVDSEISDALLKAVGGRVQEMRVKAGLTQEAFARAAGMSAKYAWRVEHGRQNLSLRSISRIAIALDIPMSSLLEGIEADPESLGTRPYNRQEE